MNRLNKWGIILAIMLLSLGLVAACGGTDEQTSPAGDADLMVRGEAAVNRACISCHGADLEGGYGPSLQNIEDKYNKEELIDILIHGKGSMPGNLAQGQEEAVAVYLLSLQ